MEFREVVRRRRMVRKYDARPVDPTLVTRILRDATRAPSAGHTQAVEFILLDSPAQVAGFWQATSEDGASNAWLDGMRTAPVVVVPLTSKDAYVHRYAEPDKGRDPDAEAHWSAPWWYVDAGMAALLVLQGAVDAGLGACLFGIPPERIAHVARLLEIPEDFEPIGAITIGHRLPDDAGTTGSPGRRPRRDPADRIHRGSWRGLDVN